MRLNSFLIQCRRVWYILKKPDKEEYKIILKISALGILAIGLIGFIISLFMRVFK